MHHRPATPADPRIRGVLTRVPRSGPRQRGGRLALSALFSTVLTALCWRLRSPARPVRPRPPWLVTRSPWAPRLRRLPRRHGPRRPAGALLHEQPAGHSAGRRGTSATDAGRHPPPNSRRRRPRPPRPPPRPGGRRGVVDPAGRRCAPRARARSSRPHRSRRPRRPRRPHRSRRPRPSRPAWRAGQVLSLVNAERAAAGCGAAGRGLRARLGRPGAQCGHAGPRLLLPRQPRRARRVRPPRAGPTPGRRTSRGVRRAPPTSWMRGCPARPPRQHPRLQPHPARRRHGRG